MDTAELASIRKHLDLTHEALGRLLGVHRITVQRWEKGECRIPRTTALALSALKAKGRKAVMGMLAEVA